MSRRHARRGGAGALLALDPQGAHAGGDRHRAIHGARYLTDRRLRSEARPAPGTSGLRARSHFCTRAQVFILELAAPFLIYVTLSVVPQRVVVAVPELMAAMLVASQGVVCVLAQMRYLLPLVLYKAAKQPPPAAAAAVEVA